MRERLCIILVFLTIICCALAGCAPAAALPAATATLVAQPTAPIATAVPPAEKTSSAPASAAAMDKISSRLQILMTNPALASASPAEQSKAFSLPPNGGGSIRFDQQGRVQVNIRVSDVSDSTLQALKAAGVVVLSVSKQYLAVSAFISPLDLAAVSKLPAVLSLEEELSPELQGGNGS
jgi:hypothetical protein